MQLKAQGVFKEMLQGRDSDPSIFDFIQTKANKDEDKIIDYLKSGIVIIACGAVMIDVVDPNNGFSGCPEWKTDGKWAWSGDLAYYVRMYHLRLDEEFIDTMRKNSWTISRSLELDINNIEIL